MDISQIPKFGHLADMEFTTDVKDHTWLINHPCIKDVEVNGRTVKCRYYGDQTHVRWYSEWDMFVNMDWDNVFFNEFMPVYPDVKEIKMVAKNKSPSTILLPSLSVFELSHEQWPKKLTDIARSVKEKWGW